MRDAKRIPVVLKTVEKLWAKYPDMRFMQLISMIEARYNKDMFYLEDDDFTEFIQTLIPKEKDHGE